MSDQTKENTQRKLEAFNKKWKEFDRKWDQYVKGEVSWKDISTILVQGDNEALKTARLNKTDGFNKSGENKIRITVIHVGYTNDEMDSAEFRDYLEDSRQKFYDSFDSKYFQVGHLMSEDGITIPIRGLEKVVTIDDDESIGIILGRLNSNKDSRTDLIDLRINPEKIGTDYFGSASLCGYTITPGPVITKSHLSAPDEKRFFQHEFMHELSNLVGDFANVQIGDGYFRQQYENEIECIRQGCHSEFFIEDLDNPGYPIETTNPLMRKVLEKIQPGFYDTGIMLRDKDGTEHKLLTPSPRSHIMNHSNMSENERNALEARGDQYITDFHKALVQELAKAYLTGKGRIKDDEQDKKSDIVTHSEGGSILLGNVTTELPSAVRDAITRKANKNRADGCIIKE